MILVLVLPAGTWNADAGGSQWLAATPALAGAVRQMTGIGVIPVIITAQPDQDDTAAMWTRCGDIVPERHQSRGRIHLLLQIAFVDGARC